MTDSAKFDTMLPYPAPVCGEARTVLFVIRRMAIHGLEDAHASHAMINSYGLGYREPLILVRTLLSEIARHARANIIVAPCCSPRMTAHEYALLSAIRDPANDALGKSGMIRDSGYAYIHGIIETLSDSIVGSGRSITV